jgi:hypothetical protein
MPDQPDLFSLFLQFIVGTLVLLWKFIAALVPALLPWLPLGLWCVWWLWCVNWKHAWPVLARGAWVPVVLLTFIIALTWAYVSPSACTWLPGVSIPNFWWQLGGVSILVALALFCGWLQGVLGWAPEEVSFDPPAVSDGHGHGHSAAH